MLAVGVGGGCLDIFTHIYLYSPLSPSLWETARHRLKYCLKEPLNPKQPTILYKTDRDFKHACAKQKMAYPCSLRMCQPFGLNSVSVISLTVYISM